MTHWSCSCFLRVKTLPLVLRVLVSYLMSIQCGRARLSVIGVQIEPQLTSTKELCMVTQAFVVTAILPH